MFNKTKEPIAPEIKDPLDSAYLVSGTCTGDNVKELQRYILRNSIGTVDTGLIFTICPPYKNKYTKRFSSDFTFLVDKKPSLGFLHELSLICYSEDFTVERFR